MKTALRILKWLCLVLVLVLVLALAGGYVFLRRTLPSVSGTLHLEGLKDEVEVIRDKWGIPHIYARNADDLFFAQGYVHAQDRLWQMEFNRRIAAGRLSEIAGEVTLDADRFLRTIGLYRAAEEEYPHLDEESKRILHAYAQGVNAFIETHKGRLPLEFTLLGIKPEPWTPVDSIAWGKVMAWDLGGNWEHELLRAAIVKKLGKEALPDLLPSYPSEHPIIVPIEVSYHELDTSVLALYQGKVKPLLGAGQGLGSNNWVVDGAKSATGMPLLANDPHLGIQIPSIWYEMALHGGGFDVIGVSFPGVPGIIIGHNDRIAWGVTNVGPDVQDLYIEKINPHNPYQYEFQGRWEDMRVVREEIRVKGRKEPEVIEVRITRHGPIINDVVKSLKDSKEVLAFRWTALELSPVLPAVIGINRADNWEEFREALRSWSVPSQNFVYADVDGNIGYQMPGLIPIRAQGDGLMPVPGWTGEHEWTGYIPFDELPSVYNPLTHYLVTANNKVVPDDYPYLISLEWNMGYRAQRIVDLLTAKEKLSLEDFKAIQADTLNLHAMEVLPYLLEAAKGKPELQEAVEQLRGWDFRCPSDSVPCAIFEAFHVRLLHNTFGDELGEELFKRYLETESVPKVALARALRDNSSWFDDVTTPDHRESREEILVRSLEEALDELSQRLGKGMGNWQWGKLHLALFVHKPIGQSGIKPLEAFFNRGPVQAPGTAEVPNNNIYNPNKPFNVKVLPSYRQLIDLGDLNRSLSIHTTGQSGNPLSPHYDDFIPLWREVRYHPMLWDRKSVEDNAEAKLVLMPK